MRNRLDKISLSNFKTVCELEDFEPGALTVLIGPNGAGKSNFISFFDMMSRSLSDESAFPNYVAERGGASKLLHDGPSATDYISAIIELGTPNGKNHYCFYLHYAAGDALFFSREHHQHHPRQDGDEAVDWFGIELEDPIYRDGDEHNPGEIRTGLQFPGLLIHADYDAPAAVTRDFFRGITPYQFHNTSAVARMRTKWRVSDNRRLKSDAANIAPMLLRLKERESGRYRRIVDTIRLILPFFSDFELEPDYGYLLLAWRERHSDEIFDVSQASDGMLRVISLVTLLLQPEDSLPDVLILDEPELGLHPYAINVIGGLIRAASTKTQVIVATQSAAMVDCFDPEDVVVVGREECAVESDGHIVGEGRATVFRRLDSDSLSEWLEDYSLSELWEKNVIGGRP